MKDSRPGAFGGIGLALAPLLKLSALASLPPERAMPAILLAASLGRWCLIPAGFRLLARPGAMGADFAAGLQRQALVFGTLPPLAGLVGKPGVLAYQQALYTGWSIVAIAHNRLNGVTGDVFGLIVEGAETTTLLAPLIEK